MRRSKGPHVVKYRLSLCVANIDMDCDCPSNMSKEMKTNQVVLSYKDDVHSESKI